jgi:Lar family restriction alleviation protein
MTTLKPCPFCGGLVFSYQGHMQCGQYTSYIACSKCYCRTREYVKRAYAAKVWNRRVKEASCPTK